METLSLDLNPYAQRGVLLDAYGQVLSHFDSRSPRTTKSWLRKALQESPGATIIGSPLDDWPAELLEEARIGGASLEWLNPSLLRLVYNLGRPWNLQRKLHRARLLAYLHRNRVETWDLEERLRAFEHTLARETLDT